MTTDRVQLEEVLTAGHLVTSYRVDVLPPGQGAQWRTFSQGQPIGTKRIDLGKPLTVAAVRLVVLEAFAPPTVTLSVFQPCQ